MDFGLSLSPPLQLDDRDGINIEFCSGYTGTTGQWISGFYCPNDDDSDALFCCGTSSYKYCCSVNMRDLIEENAFKSWYIIIGVILGVSLTVVLTILVCRMCRSAYKRENKSHIITDASNDTKGTSLSTAGIANMYSFPNHPQQDGETVATTRAVSQLLVELESRVVLNKSFSFSSPNAQISLY